MDRRDRARAFLLFVVVVAMALAGCRSASGTSGSSRQAQSESADVSFAGKTITMIVGFGAGGGYDTYTRLVARHLGRHIPGNPNVIVENMPGAGSLTAANHLYNVAPKDGTVIGHFSGNLFMQQV